MPNSGKAKWRNDRTQQGRSVTEDHAIELEEARLRGTVAWDLSVRVRNRDGSLVRHTCGLKLVVGRRVGLGALL